MLRGFGHLDSTHTGHPHSEQNLDLGMSPEQLEGLVAVDAMQPAGQSAGQRAGQSSGEDVGQPPAEQPPAQPR